MADITLTTTESNIVVDASNNIINVTSTPTTIVVAESSGLDQAAVRQSISNISPILYNNVTGVISFDTAQIDIANSNIKLKQFSETVVNNGDLNGNVTLNLANGSIHTGRIVGNITGITLSNVTAGSSALLILTQDSIGNNALDTTTYASNWSNYVFVGDNTELSYSPNKKSYINIVFDGTKYNTSVFGEDATSIPNSQLANSSLTVNGTTISLGSSGNISNFGALTTTNLTEGTNLYFTAARARGNVSATTATGITYDSANGVFSLASIPNSSLTNSAITINGTAVALGGTRTLTTSNIAEGTNLYFTPSRVHGNISATTATGISYNGSGVFSLANIPNSSLTNSAITINGTSVSLGGTRTLTTTDIAEGTNLYFTAARANSNVVAYIATVPLTVGGNLTVNGNINATGNINYQNVTDLYVTDQKITLNSNAATNANVEIISNRPTATNTMLKWNEQSTRWEFTNNGTTYYPIPTSTTDLAEGANLWFTTDRVRSNISVAENLTYSNSTGVIGMANSLANVNSITAELGQNHTLTSDKTVIQSRVRNDAIVTAANVEGLGFAIYDSIDAYFDDPNFPFITYSGTEELKQLIFDGDCTAGSNVITISAIYDATGTALAVSNVKQYYGFCEFPGAFGESTSFPAGTYVTSVSGSNVYMSANALTTTTFYTDLSVTGYSLGCLFPMAYDTVTGFGLGIESEFDTAFYGGGGSATTIGLTAGNTRGPFYGYPASGPIKADLTFPFDTANFSVASFANTTLAKTDIGASRTVPAFTRGLTVGAGDLTSRGVADKQNPTFGLNILWDGTANVAQEYGASAGVFPQILLRSFSDGTSQGVSGNTAASWSAGGPRLLFINGNGNANDPILTTYALQNQELGKIGFTSTSSFSAIPSSLGPAAYITAISNKDQIAGPGDVGLYLVASPTAGGASTNQIGSSSSRLLWAGHHKSNTIISAGSRTNGTCGNVIFAPGRQSSNQGNAVLMSELIVNSANGSPHWATIGYDVPTSNTGAKISITNGHNTTSARNGNLTVSLNRRDNGVGFGSKEWAFKLRSGQTDLVLTEDNVIGTTFASGGNINLATNASINYDEVYGAFHKTANVTALAADTAYAFDWTANTTTVASNRVTVSDTSRINIAKTGAYKVSVTFQIRNDDNALRTAYVWLRKNGTDVPETTNRLGIVPKGSATSTYQHNILEWLAEVNGGDYIEIMFAVDNTSGISLEYNDAQASPYVRPAIPSAVLAVRPVGA